MRAIGLILCLLLIALPAAAENATTVEFTCAPWDGAALGIQVGVADGIYKIKLWGNGWDTIYKGGHKLDISENDGTDSAGNGRAELCGTDNKCHAQGITLEFSTVELRKDGIVKGTINGSIPFEGKISSAQQFCG